MYEKIFTVEINKQHLTVNLALGQGGLATAYCKVHDTILFVSEAQSVPKITAHTADSCSHS